MTPGKKGKVSTEEMSLVEVGPRVCLQPIKIFAGSFGGPVLYENPGYVSPNKVSAMSRPDTKNFQVFVLCSAAPCYKKL